MVTFPDDHDPGCDCLPCVLACMMDEGSFWDQFCAWMEQDDSVYEIE